jgi:soluble lytic murein transglycosylase
MARRRNVVIFVAFFSAIATMELVGPRRSTSELGTSNADIPPEAIAAVRDGRYMRASMIMREYMAAKNDSTPSAVLLAARAEAGWGDWERVRLLLEGRSWLDDESNGFGWSLLGRSQISLGRTEQGRASLARYLEHAEGSEAMHERGVAALHHADVLAAQGEHAKAVTGYDNAAKLLPLIEDWISLFAASAAATAGDTAQVRARFSGADSSDAMEWGWRAWVRAFEKAGDDARAIAAAERAATSLGTASRRAAAWTLLAGMRADRNDVSGARVAFNRAMSIAPASPSAIESARQLSELYRLSPAEQLAVGRIYLRAGNTSRAASGIDAYLSAGLGTAEERQALRYDLANALFRTAEYDAAEKALLAVAAATKTRSLAGDALYTAARAQYRDGRHSVSKATLARIIKDYSDQPAAVRAAFLTADLAHDDEALDTAVSYYRQTIRLSPASDDAGIARMRLIGIALEQERYDEALREAEEMRITHKSGRAHQQATYWTARILAKLGRADEARERLIETRRLDPFSYYGGLAADQLESDILESRLAPSPAQNARYDAEIETALRRVDLLREVGWDEAATFEMQRVRNRFAPLDGALYSLAEALNQRGFTDAGIAIGWDLFRSEGTWNMRLMRIVYPFPFQNIIIAEAHERGVDPYLAAALIRQESMFNPLARSPVGALGLMQVMPATGAVLARSLGVTKFRADMLHQPELNVHFGMRYLADQLQQYGNRLDLVLAAYNAGPTRVTRWEQFPEYDDAVLFAERIPFAETRDYVRIVQNNRRIYKLLYGELSGARTPP